MAYSSDEVQSDASRSNPLLPASLAVALSRSDCVVSTLAECRRRRKEPPRPNVCSQLLCAAIALSAMLRSDGDASPCPRSRSSSGSALSVLLRWKLDERGRVRRREPTRISLASVSSPLMSASEPSDSARANSDSASRMCSSTTARSSNRCFSFSQ